MSETRQREREPGHRRPRAARPAARTRTRTGGRTSSNLQVLHQHSPRANPMGEDFSYAEAFAGPRRRGAQARRRRGHDDLAGLVAGRLRPLRPALHPDELALGRHLPHRGRPRRCRRRRAALRPAQQLAGQRQPRQGAPPAVAGQAEVRPAGLVGRPARLRRQRRAGVDGLQDLRLRLRPRGRLGARGDLLGSGGHLARRRALRQRRPRAGRPARRRADGPDLRQPGGAERQPRPAGGRARHPRDVPPDGDERRGDRRAHRRRALVRQDARRRLRPTTSAPSRRPPRSRSRASAGAAPTAPARAGTPSPAASRSPGPARRRSGAPASSRTSSATSGSSPRAPQARSSGSRRTPARPCRTRSTRRRSTGRPC